MPPAKKNVQVCQIMITTCRSLHRLQDSYENQIEADYPDVVSQTGVIWTESSIDGSKQQGKNVRHHLDQAVIVPQPPERSAKVPGFVVVKGMWEVMCKG